MVVEAVLQSCTSRSERPMAIYRRFSMKGIIAISVAVAILWIADHELNDGRYSAPVQRAILSLIGR
jgi:hypothetical protein